MKRSRLVPVLTLCGAFLVAVPARAGRGGAGARVRYAVLPLRPKAECSKGVARRFTRLLERRLRGAGARTVRGWVVRKAWKRIRKGRGGGGAWTTAEVVELGRAVGADRVVAGAVRLQAMRRARGDVWEISLEQVDVGAGREMGRFRRVTAFGRRHGAALMRRVARRVLAFDPNAPPLKMTNPAPAKVPPGAPSEPGMVYIPAGEFIMGSDDGELDEAPRHVVYTDAFFIDRYEVTNAEYDRCVAARKCKRSTARRLRGMRGLQHPVAGVGFWDAVSYCRFAGKRLLTEAEWEKAARGPDERAYPWGNDWHPEWVNQATAKDGFKRTAPVGSFARGASPYGVMDMAGNVWEWTADVYEAGYYRKSPARNPTGPRARLRSRRRRVMRGGSWMYDVPFFVTTHNRSPGRPWIRKRYVGIRCGKDAPGGAASRSPTP